MSDEPEDDFEFDQEPEAEEAVKEAPPAAKEPVVEEQLLPAMTPSLRRRLQMCYDHGTKLMKEIKYDHSYVHTLLSQAVAGDPNNLAYLDALLDNLHRQHKGKAKSAFGWGSPSNVRAALDKKQWVNALKAGLDNMLENPWDVPNLRAIAEACEALVLNDAELRFLKLALEAAPKNAEVAKHCAKSLTRIGIYDQAIACWHRVESINRIDEEAAKAISDITMLKNRIASGLATPDPHGGVATPRAAALAKLAPQKKAEPESAKKREIKLTPRQVLERAIEEYPTDIENYFKLADLLLADARPGEAVAVLQKAVEESHKRPDALDRLEAAQLEQLKVRCGLAEKKAQVEATPEAQEAAKKLQAEVARLESEHLANKAARHPERKDIKLEVGHRLKKLGQFAEAIPLLTDASQDPALAAAAFLDLGECQQQLKQIDKAINNYKRALQAATDADPAANPKAIEQKKLALYRIGLANFARKDLERAEKYLKELVKLDANFRDAKARLDKVREMRHKG